VSITGNDQPKTVSVYFSIPEGDCATYLLEPPMTGVYATFSNDPSKEVFLFCFDPNEMRHPFQEKELLGKTKDEIRLLRGVRSGLFPERVGGQNALFHPISAQATDVATILRAEILEYVDLEDGYVVKRNTTHVLRVEFLQMRGRKLSLYDFCPDHFNPKLEADEFVGLSVHEAMVLVESRRVG